MCVLYNHDNDQIKKQKTGKPDLPARECIQLGRCLHSLGGVILPMKNIYMHDRKNNISGVVFVDDNEYSELNKHRWHWSSGYCGSPQTTIRINNKYKSISMHHMILGKPEKGFVIDHIDRNVLNNKKSNLRFVTVSTNSANTCVRGEIPYRGISIKRKNSKGIYYRAVIRVNKKVHVKYGKDMKDLYYNFIVPLYKQTHGITPTRSMTKSNYNKSMTNNNKHIAKKIMADKK